MMKERKSMVSHLFYDINVMNFGAPEPAHFFNVPVGTSPPAAPLPGPHNESDVVRIHKEHAGRNRTYHDTNIEVASQTVHDFIVMSIDVVHLQTGALAPIVNACLFDFFIGSTRFLQVPLWRFVRGPYVLNKDAQLFIAPGQNFGATITPSAGPASLNGLVGVFLDGVRFVPTL